MDLVVETDAAGEPPHSCRVDQDCEQDRVFGTHDASWIPEQMSQHNSHGADRLLSTQIARVALWQSVPVDHAGAAGIRPVVVCCESCRAACIGCC